MDNNSTNKPYRQGVIAIVIDKDNNFLLIQKNKYRDNEWNFLGGGREEGESLEQNLFRELKEEIGAKKQDFEIIGVSKHKIEYDYPEDTVEKVHNGKYRGQSYDQVILKFIGNKENLKFNRNEFKNHKWVKANELAKNLIFPNQYDTHKKAIKEIMRK